jgi:hypothetical protein
MPSLQDNRLLTYVKAGNRQTRLNESVQFRLHAAVGRIRASLTTPVADGLQAGPPF